MDSAVSWAAAAWGREVVGVRRLAGGLTSTMLALTAADGARAALRLMTREPWSRHAVELLRRESATQGLLNGTDVPAPTSLALDVTGERAGAPAHLMSWQPGSLALQDCDDELLPAMSEMLRRIHAVDPLVRPRTYQSWVTTEKRVVPRWSTDGALWTRAFQLIVEPPPSYDGVFLHRDYHLGNILWLDGEVSGIVDWVETSWGPADLDTAHAMANLAMLHGVDVAARFGALEGPPGRYWAVLDAVGFLPDPARMAQGWRDCGVAITDEVVRSRLEAHLARMLD